MQLPPNSTFIVIFVLVIGWQIFSTLNTTHRIWCSFRRRDRTKLEKWAKDDQGRIDFDGAWYHVEPSRCVLMLKWMPLPMWVRALDYRWNSARALHPDTFETSFDPTERKRLDRSDEIRAFDEGGQRAMKGGEKKGMLERLFPIIVLVGFVIIGFMLWRMQNSVNMLGIGQNYLEGVIHEALGR